MQLQSNSSDSLLDLTSSIMLCSTSSETSSSKSTAAVAFCCSLFSHLLAKFQEIFNLGKTSNEQQYKSNDDKTANSNRDCEDDELSDEDEDESRRAKLRRRKVTSGSSDQDFSEEELFMDTDSGDDSQDEAISESGFHSADAKFETHLEIPTGCTTLLPLFNLITGWLQVNAHIIQVSSQSARKMWISLAEVLNVFRRCQTTDIELNRQAPLEEDWKFFKVPSMNFAHSEIDFDRAPTMSTLMLNSLRIERILLFGKWLAEQDVHNGFKVKFTIIRFSIS